MAAVDRHLAGPAHLRLLGGAALHLGYGAHRVTEDADLLMEDAELQALIETANLGVALELANADLEPEGLYLTHIWGPEHQILTPEWRTNCRDVVGEWERLSVSVLGPVDLILSKMCRADEGDLADIDHILTVEGIGVETLEAGFARAVVPEAFTETFARARGQVLTVLRRGH